jgi:hypothetical protein
MSAAFFQRKSAAEARLFYKFRRGHRTLAFLAQKTQNNFFPQQTNCGKESGFWVFAERKGGNVWSKNRQSGEFAPKMAQKKRGRA